MILEKRLIKYLIKKIKILKSFDYYQILNNKNKNKSKVKSLKLKEISKKKDLILKVE